MIALRLRRLIHNTLLFKDEKVEYHPEPNVNNHLAQVATLAIQADDNWDVVLASVLHDIGKNTTNKQQWREHAYRGALIVSPDVTEKVRWLVENHMKAIDYSNGVMREFKRKDMEAHKWFDDLMRLNRYDTNGRNADGVHMPWEDIYHHLDETDRREKRAIMMVGIQAAGKSTISRGIVDKHKYPDEQYKSSYERTSKDDIRLIVGHGPGDFRHQENCVLDIQHQCIRMALGRGQGIVIDNCHNTIARRRQMLKWLKEEFPGIHVEVHLVYAPLEVCIKRNRECHGQVYRHRMLIPDNVLKQFHGDLVSGLGKITDDINIVDKLTSEGFDSIVITRND